MTRHAFVLLLALAPALGAQQPGDSGAGENQEARQLREQIRQRWNEHVRSTLALSDDQAAKLQDTEQRFEVQRTPIRARQRAIAQALRAETQSGSPNQDRVTQLVNEQQDNQLKLQQINRGEDREIQGYLTPVQRARYHDERRRFQEKVQDVVRQYRQQHRPPAPGDRPAGPRPARPRRKP